MSSLATVNVKTGLNKPPIPQLRKVLDKFPTYDRTTINSWEDVEFRKAVEATSSATGSARRPCRRS